MVSSPRSPPIATLLSVQRQKARKVCKKFIILKPSRKSLPAPSFFGLPSPRHPAYSILSPVWHAGCCPALSRVVQSSCMTLCARLLLWCGRPGNVSGAGHEDIALGFTELCFTLALRRCLFQDHQGYRRNHQEHGCG